MRPETPPEHAHHGRSGQGGEPEFGPGGYLPPRAADRARKIVLRERMALSWPIAAVIAGLIVLGAGTVFLLQSGAPGESFVALTRLPDLPAGETQVVTAADREVLVVRAQGALHAYLAPDQAVRWCAATGRLEGADAAVWRLNGRRVGGTAASLRPVPTEVHAGVVYGAVRRAAEPPTPGGDATPGCSVP